MATYSELLLLMSETRKWLTGDYEPLPAGVTLLIKPRDYEHAALKKLSDEELIGRAGTLLGDAHRVISQLVLAHPSETRVINNLTTYASALSDMLQSLEKRGQGVTAEPPQFSTTSKPRSKR